MGRYLTAALVSSLVAFGAGAAAAATATIYYTYDPVGRVITARYDNNTCIVYAYDANGNRVSQTNTLNAGPETPTWGTGTWGCFLWTAQHVQLRSPAEHLASSGAHGGHGGR